ncbi:hypothetical protein P872_00930 [Rhodonellum psychrophilum GCM71 = DSM 17998]|uniref:Uncharacterized protein n=2 Tax=Rhodonellum TaxID=336827 RepID=U5BTZ4_9BACT|nr:MULTISPECIES: hypothetical protein [Rhodonellum]ERM84105.1 hypothetical protein P872_00930 [Rhodonellum psychrophilum GCM71 = DSM 17998]SDY42049.1 hypothetical protein SAMN05444412_101101 [Rhodonellum ikkaensis]
MKYISAFIIVLILFHKANGQNMLPESFFDGKSVVLISNSPQAQPSMDWKMLSEKIHSPLVAAGADPIGYYELEDIALSGEVQAGYGDAFSKRKVANIILLTRKANGELVLNITPFTKNKNIVSNSGGWSTAANSLEELSTTLENVGKSNPSKNYLVLEVPEFPNSSEGLTTAKGFIAKNPLNLEVFKLGVPLTGAVGEEGFLSTFRYDLLGKSPETVLAEQNAEKGEIESILKNHYSNQVEYLTEYRTDAELIANRVQFLLMRLEAREGDLMKSMGLEVENIEEKTGIVVKYYIRFLVRNENYIGPKWDAHPNAQVALRQFLENLKKN